MKCHETEQGGERGEIELFIVTSPLDSLTMLLTLLERASEFTRRDNVDLQDSKLKETDSRMTQASITEIQIEHVVLKEAQRMRIG